METLAELPFIGDQVVCLSHDQAARSGWGRVSTRINIEREWLFHEDGFARRGGALDLRPVLAVRRCKNDGIDRRVGEQRIKIVRQRNAVLSAKSPRPWRACGYSRQ